MREEKNAHQGAGLASDGQERAVESAVGAAVHVHKERCHELCGGSHVERWGERRNGSLVAAPGVRRLVRVSPEPSCCWNPVVSRPSCGSIGNLNQDWGEVRSYLGDLHLHGGDSRKGDVPAVGGRRRLAESAQLAAPGFGIPESHLVRSRL